MSKLFLCVFLLCAIFPLCAQKSIADSVISMGILEVTYRGGMPGADLGDRFGYLSQLGLQSGMKFANNLYFIGGVHALFGDVVKELDMFRHVLDAGGRMIGDEGLLTDYRITALGWVVPLSVGYILSVFPHKNPNSGIYVEVGGQFFRHRMDFEAYDDDVTQFSGNYRKGYDRLSAGFGVRQSVGYTYFDSRGYLNFSAGFDFSQNFTRGQRSIQFDTGLPSLERRLDLLSGFRVSWVFPIYQRAPNRVYYN